MNDIEDLLRDRLRSAAPDFTPVPMHAISDQVQRRRKTVRGATIAVAAILSGTAIITPIALLPRSGDVDNRATSGGVAVLPSSTQYGHGDSGSTSGGHGGAATPTLASGRSCPPRDTGHSAIDYVDFVNALGHQYVAGQRGVPRTVPAGSIGKPVAGVDCQLSANPPDPDYKPVDGDAGYLTPGTVLYEIKGQPTGRRIAARVGKEYRVYQIYPPR